MKIKLITGIVLACAVLLAFFAGIGGASLAKDNGVSESAAHDRLVGVFITKEPLELFDFDAYFEDNAQEILNGEMPDSEQYQQRLYAELVEETLPDESGDEFSYETFSFAVEGCSFFIAEIADGDNSYTTNVNGGVYKTHTNYASDDNGRSISLSGSLYVEAGSEIYYHLNPVYQTEDGRIYTVSGDTFMSGGEGFDYEGETMRTTLSESTDGYSCTVEIAYYMVFRPVQVRILHFGAAGELLAREEYAPEQTPDSVTPAKGCEYLVVETVKQDAFGKEAVTRELCDKGNETIETFCAADGGVIDIRSAAVDWN